MLQQSELRGKEGGLRFRDEYALANDHGLKVILTSWPSNNVLVELLSTKSVHFYDKSMRLCQITNIPNTNISAYGAKPNSPLDSSTAQDSK